MASPSPFGSFHRDSSQIKKPLLPQREQGQKIHFCGTTLFAGFSDRSATVPTHRLPLTQAIRQQILGDAPFSLCPRRPIYCPAFRSALSYAKLSVDALYSFTSASKVCLWCPYLTTLLSVCQELFSAVGGNGCQRLFAVLE